MKDIQIDTTIIGDGHPTYVIAEIGINHNGDEQAAKLCIDAAVEAKANAVKFQKRHLPSLYMQEVLERPEAYEQNFQYMIPLLKKIELSDESYARLKKYCDQKNIDFLCTPFDTVSADFLEEIEVPAYKIASADLTNSQLLRHVGRFRKPMILSTGMSNWAEVERAVGILQEINTPFALLHCKSVYPVWPRDVNLQMIYRLRQFGVPVGYSGHEVGITIALVAASMGANIIEKHLTLDRTQEGPDHKVSLEPYELKRLVRDIREADQAMGRQEKFLLRGEVLNRELFAKSLIASKKIAKDTVITDDVVTIKGPGKGLAPDRIDDLLGVRANRDISQGMYFVEEDLKERGETAGGYPFTSDWGLIARFTDYKTMLRYNPKVVEFHLAEGDFSIPFAPEEGISCQLVVHVPEYMGENLMDLCSPDDALRRASVEVVCKTLRLTHAISCHFEQVPPKVIIHPGAMTLQTKLDAASLHDALARSMEEIRATAESQQLELLLENLPPYPWYFGGQWKGNYFMDGNEIAPFCRRHDINICFDLSHAALYCNAKEKDLAAMVKTLLPFTRHLHLADGYGLDGEGVQFGDGTIDLDKIMPLFKDFTGSWVPEIWRGHLDQGKGFLQALKLLRRWMK